MNASHGNELWTTFVAQLRADRKRTVVLAGLVVVLMIVCVRLIGGQNPEPVNAETRAVLPVRGGGADARAQRAGRAL